MPPLGSNAESRERISQDSNDGKTGPSAGGGVSYLSRARVKVSLSPIGSWEEEAISALTRLH